MRRDEATWPDRVLRLAPREMPLAAIPCKARALYTMIAPRRACPQQRQENNQQGIRFMLLMIGQCVAGLQWGVCLCVQQRAQRHLSSE